MIHTAPLLAAASLSVAAHTVARAGSPAGARLRAAAGVLSTFLVVALFLVVAHAAAPDPIALPGTRAALVSRGWHVTQLFVDLLVALVAVGVAPLSSHRPRTLATILRVVAVALAFLAFENPTLLSLLWAASAYLVWTELRQLEPPYGKELARTFGGYQLVSIAGAVAGTVALAFGSWGAGTALWLVAIAVRGALMPVHGWLPALFAGAPLGLVVAFAATHLGVHAQLMVLDGVTGAPVQVFAVVGALTALCSAGLGLASTDARSAVGWLTISQTGLIVFGLANASVTGRAGAMLSSQATALATAGLVMTVAALEARRGLLPLRRAAGDFDRTPRMAVAFLFLGLAAVALPLTLGFPAEDLLVQGSIDEYPIVGMAMSLVTALNGINVMRCFFALFTGDRRNVRERDLTLLEAVGLTAVMAVLLVGGLAPTIFVVDPPRSSSTAASR